MTFRIRLELNLRFPPVLQRERRNSVRGTPFSNNTTSGLCSPIKEIFEMVFYRKYFSIRFIFSTFFSTLTTFHSSLQQQQQHLNYYFKETIPLDLGPLLSIITPREKMDDDHQQLSIFVLPSNHFSLVV